MADSKSWQAIFKKYQIGRHDFDSSPYEITADQIKSATTQFSRTAQREVRLLCKQDTRDNRPKMFREKGLFILPIRNGAYVIVKGEGYLDIPPIQTLAEPYYSELDFPLITSGIGDSEMQHLDFAYANSIIRNFANDDSLVLTIRGRKYTPEFDFKVGIHSISVKGVQTEIDAGFEGRNQVVLIEAKKLTESNTIIRQLFYPFKQWKKHLNQNGADKDVSIVFFEKAGNEYRLWQFMFTDESDYNSIELVKTRRYELKCR